MPATIRHVHQLFNPAPTQPSESYHFLDSFNKDSLVTFPHAKAEASLKPLLDADFASFQAPPYAFPKFQFERRGFYCLDRDTAAEKRLVFNRTVGLKESAIVKKMEGGNTRSRKEEQELARKEKERLRKIPPGEYFKMEGEKWCVDEESGKPAFSAWDDKGFPTHDGAGEALTKSKLKKLQKELAKQEKLYAEWVKENAGAGA